MEHLSELDMLYTIFEDQYDQDSIDAVYMMGCDFNTVYDMLMLSGGSAEKEEKKKIVITRSLRPNTSSDHPTTQISLLDCLNANVRNRHHKK